MSISNIEINSCIALLIPNIDLYEFYYISYLDSVNTSLNPRPNSALASYYLGITILSPYYYLYLLIVLA